MWVTQCICVMVMSLWDDHVNDTSYNIIKNKQTVGQGPDVSDPSGW